jgi:hypothetical protein
VHGISRRTTHGEDDRGQYEQRGDSLKKAKKDEPDHPVGIQLSEALAVILGPCDLLPSLAANAERECRECTRRLEDP